MTKQCVVALVCWFFLNQPASAQGCAVLKPGVVGTYGGVISITTDAAGVALAGVDMLVERKRNSSGSVYGKGGKARSVRVGAAGRRG